MSGPKCSECDRLIGRNVENQWVHYHDLTPVCQPSGWIRMSERRP
jgi:hypothetical protein